MAKEKNVLFWLGAGVVQIDGKEYGADEPLPVSKIPKTTLDRWLESGKVGAKIGKAMVGADAILDNANGKIADLEKQVSDLNDAKAAALGKVEEQEKQIDDLEKQVESLTSPVVDGKKDDGKKDGDK